MRLDPAGPATAPRLARLVAVVVSLGFSFGGVIGVADSDQPALTKATAIALLAALLALHLYNCVHRSGGRRPKGWRWTLAAQAVLTAVGMIGFASTWYGNSGFLAAALLLLVRPAAAAWAGFALVLVMQLLSALAVRPTAAEALYLVVGHTAFVGIALYGVARLADLVADLRATRTRLAEAEVARERLAFARRLNERVAARLRDVVRQGEGVLETGDPQAARERLDGSLNIAREALNETRSVAHSHRSERPAGWRPVADDLTTTAVALLGVATVCLMIVPGAVRYAARGQMTGPQVALLVACLAAFVALYLRNCTPGEDEGRPGGWGWTLGAQVVLAAAPVAVFGLQTWHVTYFLPGLTAVLLRGAVRWAVTVPLVFQDAIFHLWGAGLGDPGPRGNLYEAVWAGERALVVYGLVRMARLTIELRAARAELARTEVARERLRFARDLHDLLGFSLSVIVLKSELAFRLLGRDPERAARELSEGLAAARQALADIESVAAGYRRMSLAAESESAREVLRAAGVTVSGTVSPVRLPAEVDTVLATVLREGVTNVLRHSAARRCVLEAAHSGRVVRLHLMNDGVPPATTGARTGTGVGNLTERVRELGGRLTTEITDGTYLLLAEVPLEPALVGGDADRVDAVPGVQLQDGGGKVVADRPPGQR
ncbi:histidine kinase [Microbispora sp. NPDC049125]|uniref:sensor histidine kinase n=1 Tax=Microbispora sp. NPDC049125 TaxID=3154929 RepID=UPI003465118E